MQEGRELHATLVLLSGDLGIAWLTVIRKMDKRSNPSLHLMVLGSAFYNKSKLLGFFNETTFFYCIAGVFCFLKVIFAN